jgi:hypothetical protein
MNALPHVAPQARAQARPGDSQSRWTCVDCSLTVRFEPGYTAPALPKGWAADRDGMHCLACQREQAVMQAIEQADGQPEWKVKTTALLAFELRRDPSRDDRAIARVAHVPVRRVTAMRRELIAEGTIRGSTGGRNIGAAARAEEEIRRDPTRPNAEIAKAAGVSKNTVYRLRHRLRSGEAITGRAAS